jgi:hypothetical protein
MVKAVQASAGAIENQPQNVLSPLPGLDWFFHFTHGFTVGYYLPRLRRFGRRKCGGQDFPSRIPLLP